MYSYCHSIVAAFLNSSVGWVPTGAKQLNISAAFRQTILAVEVYVLIYMGLLAFAIRKGVVHLFDYNYYPVEFWLFYNLAFSVMVLWHMYRTIESAQLQKITERFSLLAWRLKTAGAYITLLSGTFFGIIYFPTGVSLGPDLLQPVQGSEAAAATSGQFVFSGNLALRQQGSNVRLLQEFLNDEGFTVEQEGPGSPGDETEYFGESTYNALIKFQEANNLPATGYFGPLTRDFC